MKDKKMNKRTVQTKSAASDVVSTQSEADSYEPVSLPLNQEDGADDTPSKDGRLSPHIPVIVDSFTSQSSQSVAIAGPSHSFGTFHPRTPRRWNHNASVFVASLPPESNGELDTYIRDSLGKHGNIVNIKFIHDVKSGSSSTCAFVQFEVRSVFPCS
jgi:hypothetical protein